MALERNLSTGDIIPASGVYRVIHAQHRLPHEVTLIAGQPFPRCQRCNDLVKFELLHSAERWAELDRHAIVVYELPEVGKGEAA